MLPGQWLELQNTKIRSVLPAVAQTGFPPYIIQAWNGGTCDTARSRLLVWGGGHNDYWGNEMYALDLPSLTMKRIVEPSSVTLQSSNVSSLPDGTPTSRHTYGGLTYIAHQDRFFAVNGALTPDGGGEPATWTYDFALSKWTLRVANSPMSTRYGTMAAYDSVSKLVYVKDQFDFYSYAPDTNTYTKLNTSTQNADYHMQAAIDTKRRKFVMIGFGSIKVIDLNTKVMTTLSTTNTPSAVSAASPGLGYDPIADRIVMWSGGGSVYALNMDTNAWSQIAISGGPTASPPEQGTFGRWAYIPAYRVFALVNDIDQNAWVFRAAA